MLPGLAYNVWLQNSSDSLLDQIWAMTTPSPPSASSPGARFLCMCLCSRVCLRIQDDRRTRDHGSHELARVLCCLVIRIMFAAPVMRVRHIHKKAYMLVYRTQSRLAHMLARMQSSSPSVAGGICVRIASKVCGFRAGAMRTNPTR